MSDQEKQEDLKEDVKPDSSPEGPEVKETKPEIDLVTLQDQLKRQQEQIDGLNAGIHQERQEKKVLKQQLAEIEDKQVAEPAYTDDELDDVITMRQASELVTKAVNNEVNRLRKEQTAMQNAQATAFKNAQQLRTQHEDFDEVMKYVNPILVEHPELEQSFMKDPETAYSKAYELGKKVMSKTDQVAKAETLANPVKQPATLTQKSQVKDTTNLTGGKSFADMSMEEAAEYLAEAKKKGKKAYEKMIYG